MLRINMFLKNQIDCKSTQNLDISIYKKEEDITKYIKMQLMVIKATLSEFKATIIAFKAWFPQGAFLRVLS